MSKPRTKPDSIVKARQAFEAWGFDTTYKNPEAEPIDWPPIIDIQKDEGA